MSSTTRFALLGLLAVMALGLVLCGRQRAARHDAPPVPEWNDFGAESLAADRDTAERLNKLLGHHDYSQPGDVFQGVLLTTFRETWEEALTRGETTRRTDNVFSPDDWKQNETLYRAALTPTRGPIDSDAEWLIWAELAALRRLRMLTASGRPVVDRHVELIAGHGGLRLLDLSGTRVSAAMVLELGRSLPRLRRLIVDRRMLSEGECDALRRSRPELQLSVVGDDEIATSLAEAGGTDTMFGMPPPPWLCRELIESGGYLPQDFDGTIRVVHESGGPHNTQGGNLKREWLRGVTRKPDVVLYEWAGSDATDETVRLIANRPAAIVYLSLVDTKVTPAIASSVRGLPELRVLHVDEKIVSAELIETLRGLKHLRWVTIDCPRLPSAVAAKLEAALPGVTIRQRLALRGGEWNGPQWALDLRGDEPRGFHIGLLEAFNFWIEAEARLPDTEILDLLVKQPSPKQLRLYGLPPDDTLPLDQAILDRIGRLTHMNHLELEPPLTATRYEPLENLRLLDYLAVDCRQLSAADVERLCGAVAKLPRFRELIMFDVPLSEAAVERLQTISTLRRLTLYSLRRKVRLSLSAEELFARLPQLTELRTDDKKLDRKEPPAVGTK